MGDESHLVRAPHSTGPATGWMAYGLADIWPMVDEHHDIAWSQVAAWRFMAELCNDQADALEHATAQLSSYWPATPGSAAAPFAEIVHGLIASMRDSASAAASTGPALVEILTALSLARNSVAQLVEAHDWYQGAEQAHLAFLKLMPGQIPATPTPYVPAPPEHWRAHLDDLARSIMVDTDAQVAAATQRLKVPETFVLPRLTDPPRPAADGEGSLPSVELLDGGAPSAPFGTPAEPIGIGHRPPTVATTQSPGEESTAERSDPRSAPPAPAVPLPSQPVLASWADHRADALPIRGVDGGAARLTPGPSAPPPIDVGSPLPDVSSHPGPSTEPSRAAPMVPPLAAGTRPSAGANRSATKPGGRAALWTSLRRRKADDRTDPWSVQRGVPPVIEAAEAPEHHPGPGVIGLGR